jgi:hypothetical protein
MQIYKKLETLGFFKWYCTQYGGLVYQEYKTVYDDLPLDNLIRTELNACVFKFFREEYGYDVSIKRQTKTVHQFVIESKDNEDHYHFIDFPFQNHEEAELECLKKLISIIKK